MKETKDLKLLWAEKITELSDKDLRAEVVRASKSLFTLKMKKELGEQKQTHLIKALRRYVAALKTAATTKGINID